MTIKLFTLFGSFILFSSSIFGEMCDRYERYPLAGHPVEIVSLHQTDKNIALLAEIKKTRLILMEPGVCENKKLKGWYSGQVFVMKSFTESFVYGNIIRFDAGRLR